MNSDASSQYGVAGTPSFLINGKLVDKPVRWQELEPLLQSALG